MRALLTLQLAAVAAAFTATHTNRPPPASQQHARSSTIPIASSIGANSRLQRDGVRAKEVNTDIFTQWRSAVVGSFFRLTDLRVARASHIQLRARAANFSSSSPISSFHCARRMPESSPARPSGLLLGAHL